MFRHGGLGGAINFHQLPQRPLTIPQRPFTDFLPDGLGRPGGEFSSQPLPAVSVGLQRIRRSMASSGSS